MTSHIRFLYCLRHHRPQARHQSALRMKQQRVNLIFIHSSNNRSSLSTLRRRGRRVEVYIHSVSTSALDRNEWTSRSVRLTTPPPLPGKNPGKKRCECPKAIMEGFGDNKTSDRVSNSGSSTQSLYRPRHIVQQISQLASYTYTCVCVCKRKVGYKRAANGLGNKYGRPEECQKLGRKTRIRERT
jgi:hypothetical protein